MDGIYSDFQLLRYAETRGFPRDEARCLLRDVSGGAPDASCRYAMNAYSSVQ